MSGKGSVGERLESARDTLTPAERQVAQVVLDQPQAIAFGTVAQVGAAAGVSGPTVLRLAAKVGFDGFAELRDEVRTELSTQLSPAAERIQRQPVPAPLAAVLAADLDNVHATLSGIDAETFQAVVGLLASRSGRVVLVAGDELRGVSADLAVQLGSLRPGVEQAEASPVALARATALLGPADVLLAVDLARYERSVTSAAAAAHAAGAKVVAVVDSPLAPLAAIAHHHLVVCATGVGPFDSHVGVLTLWNALLVAVAGHLRRSAAARLEKIEHAWQQADTFDP